MNANFTEKTESKLEAFYGTRQKSNRYILQFKTKISPRKELIE